MAVAARFSWFSHQRLRLVAGFIHAVPVGRCRFHRHDHLELVLHRSGLGSSRIASGEELPFQAGQATLYPADTLHDQDNREAGQDVCLHLAAGRDPPPVLRRAHVMPVPADIAAELVALAMVAPAKQAAEGRLALDLRATAAVLSLLAGSRASATAQGRGRGGLAARYLDEHFARVGRMAEVARYVGLSEDRLRHLFTAEHGVGPLEYLTRVRLDHAATLLRRTDLPLAEIARACGFATARYLCTLFKRRHGCPPGEWRHRR